MLNHPPRPEYHHLVSNTRTFLAHAFSLPILSPQTKEWGRYLRQTTWHCSTRSCGGTTPSSMTIMAFPSPIPIDGIESNPITPFFHALRLARGKIIRCPPGQRYVVPSRSTTTQLRGSKIKGLDHHDCVVGRCLGTAWGNELLILRELKPICLLRNPRFGQLVLTWDLGLLPLDVSNLFFIPTRPPHPYA